MRNDPDELLARHRRTLAMIEHRSDLPRWKDIVNMFEALGATIEVGRSGSRVGVVLRGVPAVFHAPHPDPAIHKAARASLRRYLVETGVIR